MRKRCTELDYAKGLAILLLVFSHCHPGEGVIKTWIFAFHMPIFYVVGGILQNKRRMCDTATRSIVLYLKKRGRQLVLPYYIWGLVLINFYQMLHVIAGEQLTIGQQLFSLLTGQGIASLWFIPCYLIAEILLIFVYSRLDNWQKRFCIVIGFARVFLGSFFGMPDFWLFKMGIKCIIAFLFMVMGYYGAIYIERASAWHGCLMLIVGSVLAEINGFVGIGALELKNPILFFGDAVLISMAVIILFVTYVKNSSRELRVLTFFGRDSIVVLLTNNLLIELIRLLDYKITGNWFIETGLLGSFIMTIGVTLIEGGVIMLSHKKRIRVLFGK